MFCTLQQEKAIEAFLGPCTASVWSRQNLLIESSFTNQVAALTLRMLRLGGRGAA